MAGLAQTHKRFHISLRVIEGGSGIVRGLLTEADQTQVPAYTFVNPRQIFRTDANTALREGMVVQTPVGAKFVVGQNGDSETEQGTIWKSFRLYEATKRVLWQRRSKIIHPVTKLETDGNIDDLGYLWVAIEPLDREAPDRKIRSSHEQDRFLSGAAILNDDIIDGKKVVRADKVLGLTLGVLTN